MPKTDNRIAAVRRIEKLIDKVRSSRSGKRLPSAGLDRRDFLRTGALTGVAAASLAV